MGEFKPSSFQIDIFKAITDTNNSVGVKACAGGAKTTTLIKALELIPKNKKVIFLSFSKSIVEELSKRVPKNIEVSTLHKYGLGILFANYGKVRISEKKLFYMSLKMFESWKVNEPKFSYIYRVSRLVDFMKMHMVYESDNDIFEIANKHSIQIFGNEITHAKELLAKSDKASHQEIDFADMIHLPASKNIKLRKFDYVFVDESQDLSKAQREMIKKIINPINGRLIYVGDPDQAIYLFSGSDNDSFDRMGDIKSNTIQLPLSICYRCAKSIVKEAQRFVDHIQYDENQKEGTVISVKAESAIDKIHGDVFVICRNTKPLVLMFYRLLNNGIKANIKGKEIGDSIIALINKTRQTTIGGLEKHLELNKIKLNKSLTEKGVNRTEFHPSMIDYVEKLEIIKILCSKMSSVLQLKKHIESIFIDEDVPGVLLMTIHKSKGLEKKKVFFLNPELIPSKFAITPEQIQQEWNLMYVGITRAKEELVYINNFK